MSGVLSDNVGRAGGLVKAVTASSGLTFISNTDLSSAATYDFTAFTPSSAEHYQFVLQNLIPETDDVHLWCRTSSDGGSSFDSGSSDYSWTGAHSTLHHTDVLVDQDLSDAQIALTGDHVSTNVTVGSTSTESGVSGVIHLFGPHTTSFTHVQSQLNAVSAIASPSLFVWCGMRLEAADCDGFQILFESGAIESGTISVYSLANS